LDRHLPLQPVAFSVPPQLLGEGYLDQLQRPQPVEGFLDQLQHPQPVDYLEQLQLQRPQLVDYLEQLQPQRPQLAEAFLEQLQPPLRQHLELLQLRQQQQPLVLLPLRQPSEPLLLLQTSLERVQRQRRQPKTKPDETVAGDEDHDNYYTSIGSALQLVFRG